MVNDPATWSGQALVEERAELERVLASASFSRAPALSRLLAFICEQALSGQGEFLKEYTIGTEALGRGANFDPDHDSVVRVMATRLRKRLAVYYATEGAGHKLRIQLPESGYSPKFVASSPASSDAGEAAPPVDDVPPPHPSRWRWLLPLAALLAVSVVVLVVLRHNSSAVALPARSLPLVTPAGTPANGELLVKLGADTDYRDVNGRLWRADRYCSGGVVRNSPERRILRTADPEPYRSAREGVFTCDIPVSPGIHEVHLHFAEIVMGDKALDISGDGWRRFNVLLNGRTVLNDFDIISDSSGSNMADEKILLDVEPAADGFLHFRFDAAPNAALLNGIEILPGVRHKMLPVRILAGGGPHYAKTGLFWRPDHYYLGGNSLKHTLEVQAEDPGICKTERWGNFTYAIPVAAGSYKVTLRFAERHFGTVDFSGDKNQGGAGSRVFDVFCNGEALLRNFDVFREAGGGKRETVRTFRRLKPNAQGKLNLAFVPVKDYAMVNSIEVEPDDTL